MPHMAFAPECLGRGGRMKPWRAEHATCRRHPHAAASGVSADARGPQRRPHQRQRRGMGDAGSNDDIWEEEVFTVVE